MSKARKSLEEEIQEILSKPETVILSNAEIEAALSVLWHSMRRSYAGYARSADDAKWKRDGGTFASKFPDSFRYNSQKWEDLMGPQDMTLPSWKVSKASMNEERRRFMENYPDAVRLLLELAYRIHSAGVEAIKRNGPSKDGEAENEIGFQIWEEIKSDPSVRASLAKLTGIDVSLVEP